MPDAKWLNETNVKAALQDTSLEIETVDRALIRRYTQMFRFGQFERLYEPGEIDAQAHGAIARTIGSQIAVLLKNDDGLLPLDPGHRLDRRHRPVPVRRRRQPRRWRLVQSDPLYTVKPLDGMRDVLRGLGSPATVDQGDCRRRPVQPGRRGQTRPGRPTSWC